MDIIQVYIHKEAIKGASDFGKRDSIIVRRAHRDEAGNETHQGRTLHSKVTINGPSTVISDLEREAAPHIWIEFPASTPFTTEEIFGVPLDA